MEVERISQFDSNSSFAGGVPHKGAPQSLRIKEGRTGRSPVDVRKVVRDVVAIVEGIDAAKGYTIQVALPETPLMALCEESGLNQVLLNLVANALDSMAEPGVIVIGGAVRSQQVQSC